MHTISHILMTYSFNLNWLKLPKMEGGIFLELIILYYSRGSVILDGHSMETSDLFMMMTSSFKQTNQDTLPNHDYSRPL